jgi:hypothetical protein
MVLRNSSGTFVSLTSYTIHETRKGDIDKTRYRIPVHGTDWLETVPSMVGKLFRSRSGIGGPHAQD